MMLMSYLCALSRYPSASIADARAPQPPHADPVQPADLHRLPATLLLRTSFEQDDIDKTFVTSVIAEHAASDPCRTPFKEERRRRGL